MTTATRKTVCLTNRPPVTITKANWPRIASASDEYYDNQYRFQAFRTTDWCVVVRQHDDGRTIVYATYDHHSAYAGESSRSVRRGELLRSGCSTAEIVDAIHRVCNDMQCGCGCDDDLDRFSCLAHECIEDLPAVDLPDGDAVSQAAHHRAALEGIATGLRSLDVTTPGDREALSDAIESLQHVIRCLDDVTGTDA